MRSIFNSADDKKAIVKAGTTSKTLKELKGNEVHIDDIIIFEDEKEDGTVVKVYAVHVSEDNKWYTTTSGSMGDTLDMITEGYEPAEIHEGIAVEIGSGKSSKGREFYVINLL